MATVGTLVAQASVTALIISPNILDLNFCTSFSRDLGLYFNQPEIRDVEAKNGIQKGILNGNRDKDKESSQ